MGIQFPTIWWLFPLAAIILILSSLILTRSGKLEQAGLRVAFTAAGAFFGIIAFTLPFFQQPIIHNPVLNYLIGLPLIVVGLAGRVYALLYLRQQGTTTALAEVQKLVDSGPYAWVRHPQYSAGVTLLAGWYLFWGALYSLTMLPLIAGIIYAQALIEEKFILEKMFGDAYRQYRQRVGMFVPRIRAGKRDQYTSGG